MIEDVKVEYGILSRAMAVYMVSGEEFKFNTPGALRKASVHAWKGR